MSKEDAPNFRELRHDRTCLNCKNGKVRKLSYILIDCQLYDLTICIDKKYFVCDSWGG